MRPSSSLQRSRGAATVEAVLAVTCFLLVWAGVLYVGNLYLHALEARSTARSCAWLMSAGACHSVPKECAGAVFKGSASSGEQALNDSGKAADTGGELSNIIQDALQRQLKVIFGERATMNSETDVARPKLLGGETVTIGAQYSLPCNTKKESVSELAGRMMSTSIEGLR